MTPTPEQPKHVPFWRIRREFSRLWDAVNRQRPNYGGPLYEVPSGGFAVRRPQSSEGLSHRFSPSLSGTNLTISPGYFHGPKATGAAEEIPLHDEYPFMPVINGVSLDDDSPNTISITPGQTNLVYLEATVTQRTSTLGETDIGLGSTGMTVWVPNEDTNETTLDHDHFAQLDMEQLNYHINESVLPEFKVTISSYPTNSVTSRIFPWGKFVMDAEGALSEPYEWYWYGDRSWSPTSWVKSTVSEGHKIDGSSPDEFANDASVNPT